MRQLAILALAALPLAAPADPAMECDGASQVEIGACVQAQLEAVDRAVETALGFARESASGLDEVMQRDSALPALEAAQAAWAAFRDSQCDYEGALFGGGSGTGIAIASCRVVLGRARVDALLGSVN